MGIFPGNLLIRKVGPSRQFGGGAFFFGTCIILLSIARNVPAVLGLRFLIGVGESVLQSAVIYLAAWYKRDELATRIGMCPFTLLKLSLAS